MLVSFWSGLLQTLQEENPSMSTSLLYHGFGIRGYTYAGSEYRQGQVIFRINQPRESDRCSCCGSEDTIRKGSASRQFRCVPIGSKMTFLDFSVPRIMCRQCNKTRQVKIAFADPRVTYTRSFERYALDLLRCMTIHDLL